MWPYFLLPLLALLPTLNERPHLVPNARQPRQRPLWFVVGVLLALQIGWRYEVGGDWLTYLDHVETAQLESLVETIAHSDPSYGFLNWLGAHVWGGMYLPNMVSAVLFVYGLLRFCSYLPRPWLGLSVALPYLVTVVAMGYTRQGVAIGLAMMAMTALLNERSTWRFLGWIAFAATFHKSAVILVPLALMAGSKRRWVTLLGVGLAAPLLFGLLLQESVDNLVHGYIESEYASSGAGIRVAMNALPAAIFLLCRKRFPITSEQRSFWGWLSLAALGFIVLLVISPSSTAVDRLALYWIPLQIYVWAHIPDVFGKTGRKNTVWSGMVFFYNLLVMTVWLVFAKTAFAWLPYQFYPWVWLWW